MPRIIHYQGEASARRCLATLAHDFETTVIQLFNIPGDLVEEVTQAQAFLCTNLDATPEQILSWFCQRWQVEVTFEEVRAHLGVETQRQWSDLAILLQHTTWYVKPLPTFVDAKSAGAMSVLEAPTFPDIYFSDRNAESAAGTAGVLD